MFRLPDYRETILVGAEQSTRAEIAEHDVYTLGEFKDDQFQGHNHQANLAGNTGNAGDNIRGERNGYYNYLRPGTPISDGTNGTPRIGTTTHGKQIGVNYIIKY